MPDAPVADISSWTQWGTAAGLFLGGLIATIWKLRKSADKVDNSPPDVVKLIKDLADERSRNAELQRTQAEAFLRQELWTEISRVRIVIEDAASERRRAMYERMDNMDKDLSDIRETLAEIRGQLARPRR